MDEEDLLDAANNTEINTAQDFAGLGTHALADAHLNDLGLIAPVHNATSGFRLLNKMGWKEGQGIGAKVRRVARLGPGLGSWDSHLFAPDNVPMVGFVRKLDRKGLGWQPRIGALLSHRSIDPHMRSEEGGHLQPTAGLLSTNPQVRGSKNGVNTGNRHGVESDDEDPYGLGPRISYNRTVRDGKPKKSKKKRETEALLGATPKLNSGSTFDSRMSGIRKIRSPWDTGHGGRFAVPGFASGKMETWTADASDGRTTYSPPLIPAEWRPSKLATSRETESGMESTAIEIGQMPRLDAKARAARLGEEPLPNKSVFDFMTPAARSRLMAASGRDDLPEARSEIPDHPSRSDRDRSESELRHPSRLEKDTAMAVLSRGFGMGNPYGNDDEKASRYKNYIEHFAGLGRALPSRPPGVTAENHLAELQEFYDCARMFKPMSGFMASRFKTASDMGPSGRLIPPLVGKEPVHTPVPDTSDQAAKLDMYGNLTRSVIDFHPTRLLCKRFNVRPQHPDQIGAPQGTEPFGHAPISNSGNASEGPKGHVLEQGESGFPQDGGQDGGQDEQRTEHAAGLRPIGSEIFTAVFGESSDDER